MATYRKDKGINVKSYASDPPNAYPSAFEGKLYYNSSDGQIKYQTLGAGAWGSGGNLNTAKSRMGSAGTQTAGLVAGGEPTAAPDQTEEYNGTAWSEVNELNTGRIALAGAGT